jgi:hypothetical protein
MHRYPDEQGLAQHFRFRNAPFRRWLEQHGFVVGSLAEGDSDPTIRIAETLNLRAAPSAWREGTEALDRALAGNAVVESLRACGYRHYHLGSPLPGLRASKQADGNYSYYHIESPLLEEVARHSIVWPWLTPHGFRSREAGRFDVLQHLGRDDRDPRPKFVFAHFLLPGDDWKFETDGTPPTPHEIHTRSATENYLRQLLFTNQALEVTVSAIQSSGRPSVIVIAGDVPPQFPPEVLFHHRGEAPPCDSFLAIHLPDAAKRSSLSRRIEARDLFRRVFEGSLNAPGTHESEYQEPRTK